MSTVKRYNMIVNRLLTLSYCFIGCYERETRCEPANWSIGVLWIRTGALFLGSSRIRLSLLGQCERLSYIGTACRKRTIGVHGLAREAYVAC
jgi:hypothetical protein